MTRRCCIPDCTFVALPESAFPLCQMHRHQIWREVGKHNWEISRLTQEAAKVKRDEGAVVYYVDFGDRIKIGYSARLRERLSALRVDRSALLATEPGARDLEQQRHHEFRSIRITSQREDFWKREPLLTHIETVRETHPQPRRLPDTRTVTVR